MSDDLTERERMAFNGAISLAVAAMQTTRPLTRFSPEEYFRRAHEATREALGIVEPVPEIAPAVPIRQSVRPDHVVCLVCGQRQKSLKRHLRVAHELSPEGYRERFNLPSSHPIVAPEYAARRSDLAKQFGLGRVK